ncbi:MAG: phosphatidate cytidylyltransferase [Saprospiraceae bacterium]|nr:phosphatidate cytidylyltransferase [Saprospiraceae bacterium]
MKQRAISAVLFVLAMLGGVFGGAIPFFLLFGLITGGCLWELGGILFGKENEYVTLRRVLATALGMMPYLVYGGIKTGLFNVKGGTESLLPGLVAVVMVVVFLLILLELFLASAQPFTNVGHYLTGLAYVSIPFAMFLGIAHWDDQYTPLRVIGLLSLNWANDTFAYLVGSQIGKTPFFSRISPKKTWEGTIGGMVCTFLAAWLLSHYIPSFSFGQWMALAACVAVFGTLGDLVESMLKRSVNIKDSGAILPGHGGFLDRFDSFIFIQPFVWLIFWLQTS